MRPRKYKMTSEGIAAQRAAQLRGRAAYSKTAKEKGINVSEKDRKRRSENMTRINKNKIGMADR